MEKIREETTISQLPDEVVHHILSFLGFEFVFRSCCVLSKRWKIICETLPCVNLNEISNSPRIEALNFVDKYLLMGHKNRNYIQSFHLKVARCDSPQLASHMSTWVECLSKNCNIREMSFSNGLINLYSYYSFPQAIFSAELLTELRLEGCSLELDVGVDINLASLKVLSLNHVYISHELVERLVKSCVRLKHLYLILCSGFSILNIEGLLGLEKLIINHNKKLKKVEIDEPSLVEFDYSGGYVNHGDIKFSSCTNLRWLCLSHANITEERLNEQLLSLKNLEDLRIISCREITSLNISGHCLKRLHLKHSEELSVANIIAPNLQLFTLVGQCVSLTYNNKLSLSLNAPPSLKVRYMFLPRVLGPTKFIELLKFLTMFDSSRLTFATNIPNSSIPQEWTSCFSGMKSLAQFKRFWADPSAQFLDVLRSTCPVISRVKYFTLKILKDELIEIDDDEELQRRDG